MEEPISMPFQTGDIMLGGDAEVLGDDVFAIKKKEAPYGLIV